MQWSKSPWAVHFLKSCPGLSGKVEHETCTAKNTWYLWEDDFEERLLSSTFNLQT